MQTTYRDEEMAAHLRGCAACDDEAESLIQLLDRARDRTQLVVMAYDTGLVEPHSP